MNLLTDLATLSTSYSITTSNIPENRRSIGNAYVTASTVSTSLATNGLVLTNIALANNYIESLSQKEQNEFLEMLAEKEQEFDPIEVETNTYKVYIKEL